MRIAGIYPLKNESDVKIQHAVSEPYGLEMILSVAKQEGHEVDLFLPLEKIDSEVLGISEDELVRKIVDFNPDIAAFSVYTCQYPMAEKIAYRLKEKIQGVLNIAGNRYPSFLGKAIQEPFDFFVIKEGEETFRELLGKIERGSELSGVRGISYRSHGESILNPLRERNFDLDSLPNALRFPIITNQVYRGISIPSLFENPRYGIMEYSRCCYNGCKFCDNDGFWGRRISFRSTKRVVDELSDLKDRGIDIFYFIDLNFTSDIQKTKELCEEIINRDLDVNWYCMSNTLSVRGNDWILDLMKRAGCYKIAWGIESTDDLVLKKMNKRVRGEMTTNKETQMILEKSLEAGILNQGFYIIGFPWEDEGSILWSAESLNELSLHQLGIGIFTPIPFSRFYKEMLEEGYYFDPDLEKHDRNTLIYNHKRLTNSSIKKIQKEIYDSFYNDKRYLERVERSCNLDPRFKRAFNDYFEFQGRNIRI